MKTCSTCKKDKNFTDFGRNKSRRDGLHSECKECRKFRNQTSEKYKHYQKEYWRHYRGRHVDRKVYDKKSKRKDVDNLSDSYIASRLKMTMAQLDPELIEVKREQLKIHRVVKQLNKEIQNVTE